MCVHACHLCVCVFEVCFVVLSTVAETALADVALDIMCLLMKDQWSWLCTDNIRKTIRLLFGTLIDRYCTDAWTIEI